MEKHFEEIRKWKDLYEKECQKNINLRGDVKVYKSFLNRLVALVGKYWHIPGSLGKITKEYESYERLKHSN